MEESERRWKGGWKNSGMRVRRASGSTGPGLARRRGLEKSQNDDASLGYSHATGLEIISKHTDQIHLEFVVKMGIACVVLVCLAVWFVWSFWRDSRRRRGSHGRSVSRLASQVQRPGSLDSSVGTSGSITSSAPAAYQRDAIALGDQDQDGSVVTEFFNPLWVVGRQQDGADTAVADFVDARANLRVETFKDRSMQDRDGGDSTVLPRSDQPYVHKEHSTEMERRRGPLLPRAARNLAADRAPLSNVGAS